MSFHLALQNDPGKQMIHHDFTAPVISVKRSHIFLSMLDCQRSRGPTRLGTTSGLSQELADQQGLRLVKEMLQGVR